MRVDTLRPELKEKIVEWMISFHRLDPRYKILTFFNQVASDGADSFTDETDETDDPFADRRSLTHIEKLLKESLNTTLAVLGVQVFFGIRAIDGAGNAGQMSNVAPVFVEGDPPTTTTTTMSKKAMKMKEDFRNISSLALNLT